MLAREEQVSNGGIAHSGSRRQTGSGRCRTPVEVDVAEGDGAADSGRAVYSVHLDPPPQERSEVLELAGLVGLVVDENKNAADLKST